MPRQSILSTPTSRQVPRSNYLRTATIRDFSGGWNVADNDLNLTTKFAKKLYNMQRGIDGSLDVRPGTNLFADVSDHLDEIINMTYFNVHVIAVGLNGKMVKIDKYGNVALLWDDAVADQLPGSPDGWDTTEFVSFAVMNGDLTVHNGVNKPVIIPTSFVPTFLQDPATGSNANTPIGKYAVTHGRYLVIAGQPGLVDRISISSTDTSGVFVGDDAPNDAVNIDLGSRVPQGDHTIKGLGRFRDKLVVAFEEALLPGTLGTFDGSDHDPTFDDAIENHGAISHRSIQNVGEDMLFCDAVGVNSVSRALFTAEVSPSRTSELIDPELEHDLHQLDVTSAQENRIFSIYDAHHQNYMLFVPNGTTGSQITETRCFVYKKNAKLKIEAWQEWRDWNFTSAARSALKKIFLSRGTEIFELGQQEAADVDTHSRDFIGSEEMWDDDTPWLDGRGWTPIASVAGSGVPIHFIWELPWSDNGNRMLTKQSRYLGLDTRGDNNFTAEMFVDNIYEDLSDLGETWLEDDLVWDDEFGWEYGDPTSIGVGRIAPLDPTLSIVFQGGQAAGFGLNPFGGQFSGRTTQLEQLYDWSTNYKLYKLRFSGDAIEPLKFISVTLAYQQGSVRR